MDTTTGWILHLDVDAFFAAVEQRDNPQLRGKPVLVGGSKDGRGVVSTASYEARPYGCRSAMPMAEAVRLCPQAIIVRPNFAKYKEASRLAFEVMRRYTDQVQPVSLGKGVAAELIPLQRLQDHQRRQPLIGRRAFVNIVAAI